MMNKFLILGTILMLSCSNVNANYGSYVETDDSYDKHNVCMDHSAYVTGTEVLLRSGPSTSYDIVTVTENRMHVFVSGLVGENFAPFSGTVVKSADSFKTNRPVRLYVGDSVSVKRINLGHSSYAVIDVNGESHAFGRNDVRVNYDKPIWFEVTTERGQSGYIHGNYLKRLEEFGSWGKFTYRYYDVDYEI